MSLLAGIFVGFYVGFGIGWSILTLAEVGFGAGPRLLWRVPALILGWPVFIFNALTGDRRA